MARFALNARGDEGQSRGIVAGEWDRSHLFRAKAPAAAAALDIQQRGIAADHCGDHSAGGIHAAGDGGPSGSLRACRGTRQADSHDQEQ